MNMLDNDDYDDYFELSNSFNEILEENQRLFKENQILKAKLNLYRKINQELTYFEGSLGVKSIKFWMISHNYIKGQIKIYTTKNIDRNKLKNKINNIVDEIELNADICIEFDE